MTTARIRQKNHSRFHQLITEDLSGEVFSDWSLVKFYDLMIPCPLQIKKSNSLPSLVLKWIDNDMSLRLY